MDPSKGYKGISCFLAEKDHGVVVSKKEQKLGIRASSTALINFDDMKIPLENLVGKEGQGYKYAIEILNEGRIGIGAQQSVFISLSREMCELSGVRYVRVGIAMGAFEKAVPYTYQRKQFGKAVGDFQASSSKTYLSTLNVEVTV